jgi:3-oxoadipate enol-lactonase
MAIRKIKGEKFNIQIDGMDKGPVLMFSNSLSSNLTMWDPQVAAFAKTHRIIRYDSRGHGKSVAPERAYSIAELGADALAVMDAVGVETVDWCGLSKGGMVGQWLLTHHPHRIRKAILANTAAQMAPPELWNGRILTVKKYGMAKIVDATIDRWMTKGFQARDPGTIAKVRKMILATPAQGYCGCAAAIRDMDQRESIRTIANPVLLIAGTHDMATTVSAMRLMLQRIKGSNWVELDASHISNLEQAAKFTKAMKDFL